MVSDLNIKWKGNLKPNILLVSFKNKTKKNRLGAVPVSKVLATQT